MDTNNLYKTNPSLIAMIVVENGNIVFDFDETKMSPSQMMIALHKITGEYLRFIDEQQPKNNKQG